MRKIALAGITLYRRYLSPIKGFSCAYRLHRGGASCSAHGYRVIERYGVRTGLRLLRRRLNCCSRVHYEHATTRPNLNASGMHRYQSGFCDAAFDACNVGSCACDILGNSGSFPCDPTDWSRKKKNEKQGVRPGQPRSASPHFEPLQRIWWRW